MTSAGRNCTVRYKRAVSVFSVLTSRMGSSEKSHQESPNQENSQDGKSEVQEEERKGTERVEASEELRQSAPLGLRTPGGTETQDIQKSSAVEDKERNDQKFDGPGHLE